MSEATGGDNNKQSGGFDFKTLVSVAALIAAGASIYYSTTIDSSDKVADLEGSLKSLNTKVNALPDSDRVKTLISENVKFPPAGPSAADIQAMIDSSTLKKQDVEKMIATDTLKTADVQAMIDKSTLKTADVQAMIDKSTLKTADVQGLIDGSKLTKQDVEAIVAKPVEQLRTALSALPGEDKIRMLAQDAADAADQKLVTEKLPGLISTNAVPKGAVVAFATACPTEQGWKEYEKARGRFLVATGTHTDKNGTARTYELGTGDDDGEYEHTLSSDEMPAHRHAVDRQGPTRGIEGLPPIGTDGAIIETIEQEMTHPAGLSKPHNNVPPYIALYFCEKT